MKKKIKKATANYTGGGIYIYSGETENGEFFLFSDDWGVLDYVLFLDTNPDTTEEYSYFEWQEEHKTSELNGSEARTFCKSAIKKAIKALKNGERMNASIEELEMRLSW